jgi:hypothetical protein
MAKHPGASRVAAHLWAERKVRKVLLGGAAA